MFVILPHNYSNNLVSCLPEIFLAFFLLAILIYGSFCGPFIVSLYDRFAPSFIKIVKSILIFTFILILNNSFTPQMLWSSCFVNDCFSVWAKLVSVGGLILCLNLCDPYLFFARFKSFEFFFFCYSNSFKFMFISFFI